LRRIRWHDLQEGSQTPTDALLDEAERAISEGVREMACRLNRGATSFQQTADHLARAAHIEVSKETLRQLIEQEGRAVIEAQRRGELSPDWQASDCRTESGTTRVYLGGRWRDGALDYRRREKEASRKGAPETAKERPTVPTLTASQRGCRPAIQRVQSGDILRRKPRASLGECHQR
jgi:hypothetical protein